MNLDVLYSPSGNAGEYSNKGYAVNFFTTCENGCVYCYGPKTCRKSKEQFFVAGDPKKNILQRLEKDLHKVGKLDEPIFLDFLHDPYQSIERRLEITRRAIELIKASGNNVRILTKGATLAERDFDLLDSNDEFGVTLTCPIYECSKLWEPNADAPGFRITALQEAQRHGIKTWISFEPVINPDWTLELIKKTTFVDVRKIGKMNHIGDLPPEFRKQVEGIDWGKFARDAKELCESLGVNYVLKNDLLAHLEGR
jgi:DNA repair photolyase